jgi:hypothetical protein
MSTALIPNIILGASLIAVIVASGAWAIATAHRDHRAQVGVTARRAPAEREPVLERGPVGRAVAPWRRGKRAFRVLGSGRRGRD